MRGVLFGVLAALLGASLARPAPVPPARLPNTPEGRFALQLALPPLGLFDARKGQPSAPTVSKDDLRHYPAAPNEHSALHKALHEAHLLLWASSPATPPKALAKDVDALRKKLKQAPSPLLSRVTAAEEARQRPALERRCKDASVQIARLIARLETVAELLQYTDSTDEPRRVRAWHTYLTAALLSRAVYLDEHQGALGRMRKEAPPLTVNHRAWALRATDKLSDAQSKRRCKSAAMLWQRLIKDNPDSVWEALAREALKAPLGVEWVSAP